MFSVSFPNYSIDISIFYSHKGVTVETVNCLMESLAKNVCAAVRSSK